MKYLAVASVGMGFRGASRIKGRQPDWMQRASDVRFVDMTAGDVDSTLLHFQAPRFGEVAQEVYKQGLLFGSLPQPTDTAFDVLGDILSDISRKVRDSDRFDTGILKRLDEFRKPIFKKGVDEIVLSGDRIPSQHLPRINEHVVDVAASLYMETPVPVRARVVGRLDMIRASDKVFSLILRNGSKLRGIWLGQTVKTLSEQLDQDVVINGVVTYKPSGLALRLDADAVDPAGPTDELFDSLPKPGARLIRQHDLLKPQSSIWGMQAVFGKWPGDETVTGRFKTGQRGARSPGFKTGQCPDASYTSCSSLISNNV